MAIKHLQELTDKIVLKDWFKTNNRVENFTFEDGTTLHVNDIVNLQGTDESDTVHLVDDVSDVNLSLKNGDDVVQTAGGNDTIEGGFGNDTISSGNGDDVLIGNEGADNLQGGAGDDTYVFSRGDGKDTIYDTSGNDTLKFKEGITQADLILKADVNSNDLIVALKDGDKAFAELTDKIVLKDWFKTNNRVENFTFEDGTTYM